MCVGVGDVSLEQPDPALYQSAMSSVQTATKALVSVLFQGPLA